MTAVRIHVTVAAADAPRRVDVPDDLAAAISTEPDAKAFFERFSNSLQRYHVDNINGPYC